MHKLSLAEIAQHVYLNRTYISQLFTSQLGINFTNYLESIRMQKACELLQSTDLSVTEIAAATGYTSQSYFTKVFKKRQGIGPLQYRNDIQQNSTHI